MIGKLYIDGIDTYSQFGVFVAEGGYDELVVYAPVKSVVSNNWHEEDGEEFDLSFPVLDSREFSIDFAAHGSNYGLWAFVELFADKAYHIFEFKQLGRTYQLRLVSMPNLNEFKQFGTFSLRFAYDFPLKDYVYKPPISSIFNHQGFELDKRSLSDYGVMVLEGALDEIKKSPTVKKNLLINTNSLSGAVYDDKMVTFETKDVKINCFMRVNTLAEFWCNYDALLFDLTRPGERVLYVNNTECEYPCYYKSCSVSRFHPIGKIWFEFSLNLVFTGSAKLRV